MQENKNDCKRKDTFYRVFAKHHETPLGSFHPEMVLIFELETF
jgi:hypothetical protein